MKAAPADVVLSTLRGARVAVLTANAPAAAYLILNSSTDALGSHPANVAWLPLALAVVAMQSFLVLTAVRRRTPPWCRLIWLAIVVCVGVLIAAVGSADLPGLWFVAAAGAIVFPPRLGVQVLAASIVAFVALAIGFEFSPESPVALTFYYVVSGVAGATGPFVATRLLGVVDDLARTRAQLALTAADEERRRLSRDLHDALGQGLSAIALKGDLALALLEKDAAAAQREIDSLTMATERLHAELPDIVAAGQAASYTVEVDRAERLLREAGVEVQRRGEPGPLPGAIDTALGWVVREAATNVLRHSDARRWTLHAGHGENAVWLEATNDRARPGSGPPGTGLVGMSERLQVIGGRVRTHSTPGRFTLRVEVPS
jgi:two-component system sensor histidine kinase DesK